MSRHTLALFGLKTRRPGAVTIQYPEKRKEIAPRHRSLHRLITERGRAARAASPACSARRSARRSASPSKPPRTPTLRSRNVPARFSIDLARCCFCGFCVEACPEDAIRMDTGILEIAETQPGEPSTTTWRTSSDEDPSGSSGQDRDHGLRGRRVPGRRGGDVRRRPPVRLGEECPPDAENRVPPVPELSSSSGPRKALILADTGIGTLLGRRYLDHYGFRGDSGLRGPAWPRSAADPRTSTSSSIRTFISTTAAGTSRRDPRGPSSRLSPGPDTSSGEGEWENALHPVARDKPSYFPARLKPLEASGRLDLIEGDASDRRRASRPSSFPDTPLSTSA